MRTPTMERSGIRLWGGSGHSTSALNCKKLLVSGLELLEDSLWGFPEFLYLYIFQVEPPQARLQTILRRNSCPVYPAVPRISRKFCGIHYVGVAIQRPRLSNMSNTTRLVEIHIVQARLRALRLVAFTGSVFPGEWGEQWNEAIVPDLLEFGFHARKVNEFCNLMEESFRPIDTKIVQISEGDPGNWEKNYRNALNALMHMKSFTIGHAHADHRRIFLAAKSNLIATYIKVSTDRFPEVTISIFGLVDCFLSQVIPRVRERQPQLRF